MYFLGFLRLSTKSSKNLEKTKKNKKKQTHGMEKIWGVGVFFFFCFLEAFHQKWQKPRENQKKKTWDGEDLGGWGVFFFVFFGFGRLWQTLWGPKEQMVSDFLLVCDFSLV